jgi:DNA-binding transcriptional regulator/RsmH inhibitor MraZ
MSKTFLDRTSYYGQIVEMDRLGCMLVPRMLREAAQIKGEVAVVGKLTHLEVRNVKAS